MTTRALLLLATTALVAATFAATFATAGARLGAESEPAEPPAVAGEAAGDESVEPAAGEAARPQADAPRTGMSREQALLASLTIFVLAVFVGFEVISKVPPTLHTPLMSGSNAISGITIVGALIVAGAGRGWLAAMLGVMAVALASVNVVGGFLVTHRMLSMFRKR